jgi:hypothetical protein
MFETQWPLHPYSGEHMNRIDAVTQTLGTKAAIRFDASLAYRRRIAAVALVTVGAVLTGCGGAGADETGEAGELVADVDAALTEAACNTVTPPDAYMLDRNFPAPGTFKAFTTPASYGRPTCTRAHILDVHKPAGVQNIRFISAWAGTKPTTQAACQAIRLSTRSGDSITPLIAPITRAGSWTGTTCNVPSIVEGYNNFQGRARLVTQGLSSTGATVPVKITIANPG